MKNKNVLEVVIAPSRSKIILNSYRYFDIAFNNILKINYLKNARQNETILYWLESYLDGEIELNHDFFSLEEEIARRVDVEKSKIQYNITAGCNQQFIPMYKKLGKKRFNSFFLGMMAQAFIEFQNTVYAFNFGRNPIKTEKE